MLSVTSHYKFNNKNIELILKLQVITILVLEYKKSLIQLILESGTSFLNSSPDTITFIP